LNKISKDIALNRILVFRTGHLGDTVVALPAFWTLRRRFPDAQIAYLSNADLNNPHYVTGRNVLPANGLFDSWLTYPSTTTGFSKLVELWRLRRRIKAGRFDAVFYLMTRGRTRRQIDRDVRFFKTAGIRRIFGAEYAKDNLLPPVVPVPAPTVRSEADFLLDCLSSEGIEDVSGRPRTDLLLTQDERKKAAHWLQCVVSTQDAFRPLVAFAPGSKWDSKIWDENRFAEVGARLIGHHGIFPIVFGGEEDREKGERLLTAWECGANAAGILSVREAAAALESCSLYVGNDTGTMHLAAAVGTPCVAIFAAIDWPGRWYPFGADNRVFRVPVDCEGCQLPVSKNSGKCLEMIGVEEVYAACSEILESSRAQRKIAHNSFNDPPVSAYARQAKLLD
jgi:heptosyltransferase-3